MGRVMIVGHNYKGGGQYRENKYNNGDAYVIDDRSGIGARIVFAADGTLRLTVENTDDPRTDAAIVLWEGTATRGDDDAIRFEATRIAWSEKDQEEMDPSMVIDGEIEIASEIADEAAWMYRSWLVEPIYHATEAAALEQASRWAKAHRRDYAILKLGDGRYSVEPEPGRAGAVRLATVTHEQFAPQPPAEATPDEIMTDAEARELAGLLSAELDRTITLIGDERVAPAPDPFALFRHLPPGTSLFDRASGRLVGFYEQIAGDCVALRSTITGHTVYSSGLSLTPHQGHNPY